jgi:hypothetical protein
LLQVAVQVVEQTTQVVAEQVVFVHQQVYQFHLQ